ncbi:MAG: M1 family metallopeptidase [Methanobacteriota archaeon]
MLDPKAHRLPSSVRPRRYEVELSADPSASEFSGRVRIDVSIEAPTSTIELNAVGLRVPDASVVRDGRRVAAKVRLDGERELCVLEFPERLGTGAAEVDVAFEGTVGRSMEGLYLSEDGADRCLATQCEATHARNIFPCFDEPAFKAAIAWRVTTDAANGVLANGPLVERRPDATGRRTTWVFAPTPAIASYLAAVAIGRFAATPETLERRIPFRVHALGGKERLGTHGRDFAARLLPWYEDYFGVAYPFAKYDQVAIPSFSYGAMENVGLVVFRASLLLMDEKTASWRQRKAIDLVIAHEFAHMWFGNLVTMGWWDDLWLNEAFAEWIAHKAVHDLAPGHDVWLTFGARSSEALSTDALVDTHAIYHPVKTPGEATEMFDAITYGKGSAVLRMLESFLGADAFRAGLRTYMRELSGKNAAGDDLWRHLGATSGVPVREIMGRWIRQPGHPQVSLRLVSRGPRVVLSVSQKRATASPLAPASDLLWPVPLVFRFRDAAGVHEHRQLLTGRTEEVVVPVRGDLRWLVANGDDIGFYRSDPDDALAGMMVTAFSELAPAERLGFLRDQWALVEAGDRPMRRFLELLGIVASGEDHYSVVEGEVGFFRELERMLEMAGDAKALAGFRSWVASRFSPALSALGTEPGPEEDAPTRQRRAALLRGVAGVGREPRAVDLAVALARRERTRPDSVEANLAGPAVGIAAIAGDAERFSNYLATYTARRDASASPHEVDRYLNSLPVFREPSLVSRTLGLLSDGTVPKQSVGPILCAMLGEPHSGAAAWAHVREGWDRIRAAVGDSWAARIVEAAGDLPPELGREAVSFFDAKLPPDVGRQAFARARENVSRRAEFLPRATPDIVAWATSRK